MYDCRTGEMRTERTEGERRVEEEWQTDETLKELLKR